ncbi:hypothetical protein D3C75_1080660 [compost metagenome]
MKGMHQPDRIQPGVQIQPQRIGKPFPRSLYAFVPAFQTNHGTQRSSLLDRGLMRHTGKPFLPQRKFTADGIPLLTETDQLTSAAHKLLNRATPLLQSRSLSVNTLHISVMSMNPV